MISGRRLLAVAIVAWVALGAGAIGIACSSSPASSGAGPDGCADARGPDGSIPDVPADLSIDGLEAGAPYLTALSVTSNKGAASPPILPAFAPDTFDYYVRCAAGANGLTVSMTASAGAQSELQEPKTSHRAPSQTLSLNVQQNQAIVAAATNGTATTQYWVRCLPVDVPELDWAPHPEAGTPPAGYYLVGNLSTNGYALVLDGHGVPVWYAEAPGHLGISTVNSLVPESVSYYPYSRIGSFELRELSPLETKTLQPNGIEESLHELVLLPNGDYLVLADPLTYGVDLTGLSVELPDGGEEALGPNSTIQDCEVVSFSASGVVSFTWLASAHFDAAKDSTFPTFAFSGATAPDGGAVFDTFHCNSIDVDPASGNLLVSARNMDSIFYVDISSGVVLWKLGGAPASKDGATHVVASSPFYRQHDARLQPGWAQACNGGTGQVSVFDDEFERPSPARGVVYDVNVGGGDGGSPPDGGCPAAGPAGSATVAWQYAGRGSSTLAGSFRISKDGSRVIGWGQGSASTLVFSEVDLEGNDLLDFRYGDSAPSYRAIKVPPSTFDIDVLRRTAGRR
jgi:hypothetical protein